MEVGKELHHHVVLVVAFILVLLVVSISVSSHAMQALVSQPFDIHPTKNGLAKITAHNSSTVQGGPDWTQAGQEAELNLEFK